MADPYDRIISDAVSITGDEVVVIIRRDGDRINHYYAKTSSFSSVVTGASGSFTTQDGKTVTVVNGLITAITGP